MIKGRADAKRSEYWTKYKEAKRKVDEIYLEVPMHSSEDTLKKANYEHFLYETKDRNYDSERFQNYNRAVFHILIE